MIMNAVRDHYQGVSIRLSQVLDDIGVNERTVNVRRRTGLLDERIETFVFGVLGSDIESYNFGSQTEGTTTVGLNSDTDTLYCFNDFNIMQDWCDWKRGKMNLLMIQDDTTPPCYCRLQLLQSDIPVARKDLPDEHCEYDDKRRVLMKNTILHQGLPEGLVRHGPADTDEDTSYDAVRAFPCKSWPSEADAWIIRYCAEQSHNVHNVHMIRYLVKSGCFVVPTGHSSSPNERLEWRISTSIAERYIMFNMNITQIRCYMLLKMIIKTFITPNFQDTVSSYHCKTVLMYLVENTQNELWHEDNLLLDVMLCLRLLQICICANNCSHYFIPGNNLMGGRFDVRTRQQLVAAFKHIICNNGRVILGIEIDNVGDRLKDKCSLLQLRCNYLTPVQTRYLIYSKSYKFLIVRTLLLDSTMKKTNGVDIKNVILGMKIRSSALLAAYVTGGDLEREAILLTMPSLCTTRGSLLASYNISQGQRISNKALSFLSLGIESDVAAGRLKLASALFCTRELERTAFVLRDVEERYNPRAAEIVCGCTSTYPKEFECRFPMDILHIDNINCLRSYFAFGVSFTRAEIYCVPQALRYEMFRCTEEEKATRDEDKDYWMGWAVVDSLSYLYFMQYLTYGRLGMQREQQRALVELFKTTRTEPHLHHRETALNLLGQCMEQEGRLMDALVCYRCSLNERPTHNVARWHIAVLLWRAII